MIVTILGSSNLPVLINTGDQLIDIVISFGIVLGLAAVGVYLIMLSKRNFQQPVQYETVGTDLEGLRAALKMGSIDKEEYNRAVQALEAKASRQPEEVSGDLEAVLLEESVKAAKNANAKMSDSQQAESESSS